MSEGFREDVSNHVISWTIFDDDVTLHNSLTDEMEVHIDVLCTGMEFRVFQELDCALIVAVESSRQGKGVDERKFLQ